MSVTFTLGEWLAFMAAAFAVGGVCGLTLGDWRSLNRKVRKDMERKLWERELRKRGWS